MNLTFKSAQEQVNALGMTLGRTVHGEYRVNFRGGKEESAYYATDLDDAVGTASVMRMSKDLSEGRMP